MAKKYELPKTFEYKVIEPIEETEKSGGLTRLAVAHWTINGTPKQKVLERRPFWRVETGLKADKATGLNAHDFILAMENCRKIGVALEIPAKLVEEAVAKGLGAELVEAGSLKDPWKQ
jgi:hypothetical protein